MPTSVTAVTAVTAAIVALGRMAGRPERTPAPGRGRPALAPRR